MRPRLCGGVQRGEIKSAGDTTGGARGGTHDHPLILGQVPPHQEKGNNGQAERVPKSADGRDAWETPATRTV